MTDDVGNLILERLRRLDDRMTNMQDEFQSLKTRVAALDEHMVGMIISLSGINTRLDKFDERMIRIERRLDLTDAR
ncbi:hypothetical protein DBR17_19040 [Sphingomonas sp. HMWF008]|nr:hypothetical protein DBR17_19040 [Sphingomonas sp. HMWF008]